VPLEPDPIWVVLGLLLTGLCYLFVAALLGLLGRDRETITGMPVLYSGLCIMLVMVYLTRLSILGIMWIIPIGYISLVLVNHARFLRRKGETIRVRVILAGFIVGYVMSMGFVMFTGVISPWGWDSISLQELPGVILFGLAGLGMILMGMFYLWLSRIRLLPIQPTNI
jgi:hypothetical protein